MLVSGHKFDHEATYIELHTGAASPCDSEIRLVQD
jgi:hypothetical protein